MAWSHHISPEDMRVSANELSGIIHERLGADYSAYTEKVVGEVARKGYGLELQIAGQLHLAGDAGLDMNYFYKEGWVPFTVAEGAILVGATRKLAASLRLREIVEHPIAVVVAWGEARALKSLPPSVELPRHHKRSDAAQIVRGLNPSLPRKNFEM